MLVARSRLVSDLEKLGLRPGGATMVHCRMSALGPVVGGAETIVSALLDALGPAGTLMAYTG
jgi:aminoglycoside N3'-acetyltransferase